MADNNSLLGRLGQNVPVAHQRRAAQQKAAQDLQLQAAVRATPPAAATPAVAGQLGTAMATQTGQQQVASQAAQGQEQAQIASTGLQAQQAQAGRQLEDQQAGLREQQFQGAQRLAQISEQAKQEMFDSRRQFTQDEMGRKFTNERQLADYALLRARSEDDWKDYVQRTEQLSERKKQILEAAYQKIAEERQHEARLAIQAREQATARDISEKERAQRVALYEEKLALARELEQKARSLAEGRERSEAEAAARRARNQAITMLGGAATGAAIAITGGAAAPAVIGAAALGGSLGGGIGSLIR